MKNGNYFALIACCIFLSLYACVPKEQTKQTDVLVIGGTTSGISAGLQSLSTEREKRANGQGNTPTISISDFMPIEQRPSAGSQD